jgi:hypothetical protein
LRRSRMDDIPLLTPSNRLAPTDTAHYPLITIKQP